MNKNKKLAVVILAGLLVATASWYFLIYKPAHPKNDSPNLPPPPPPSGNTGLNTPPIVIGKVAYANQNGVMVLNSNKTSIYKTASAGEWIGAVYGTEKIGGLDFYKVSGDRYVAVNKVTLK